MIGQDDRAGSPPLVLLTSSTEVEPAEAAAAGILECLTKPVLGGEVRDVLVRVLRGESGGPAGGTATSARWRTGSATGSPQ